MQTMFGWMRFDTARLRWVVMVAALGMLLASTMATAAMVEGPSAPAGSQQFIHFLEWNTIKLPSDTADVSPSAPANPVERGWGTKF